jgi:hypothetical protein
MAMWKKVRILIVLVLVFLIVLIPAVYFYKHQQFLTRRHHLLCEVLKAGMSKSEVFIVLQQVGDFKVDDYEDLQSGFFALDIRYTDPKVLENYGYFSLVFIDYKYERAVVPFGSGPPEYICEFSHPTGSIAVTP